MLRGYKFRIYPTKKEIEELNKQMSLAKRLYNLLLEKARSYYKETGKAFTRNNMNNWITELKKEREEFDCLYSQVLQNVADRVSKAYRNFFYRIDKKRSGKRIKAGFPRPKKFVYSLTYPQSGFKVIPEKKRINVSKIGSIPTKFDREIDGAIKTLTIKVSKSERWNASIIVSKEDKEFSSNGKDMIGIDLGLESYATLSNGIKIMNPRSQKRLLERIKICHRSISHKKKGGKNRRKAVIKLARLSERISRQREDALHKISHELVNSYSFIAYERLDVKNMMKNHSFARSINDASWGTFLNMLCYKAESAGCRTDGVNPEDTTQECSRCNNVKKGKERLTIENRIYFCNACSLAMDRDLNAALTIKKRSLKILIKNISSERSNFGNKNVEGTAGHAGSQASGDAVNTTGSPAANGADEPGTKYGHKAIGNPHL